MLRVLPAGCESALEQDLAGVEADVEAVSAGEIQNVQLQHMEMRIKCG